ncbi:MAG: hypothetical protein NC120_13100 [Ruminococcus sp.]|nr:hypothetical protein [Ruminococcus sp.]
MNNYQPNSNRYKSSQRKALDVTPGSPIKKVVSGEVKMKRKKGIQKFADVFIAEDMHNVKDYIINDVVLPKIKDMLFSVITYGAGMVFFGEKGKRGTGASKVSYGGYYDRSRSDDEKIRPRHKSVYDYEDVVLDNRGDAEDVLCRLRETIAAYGIVTVAYFYDLIGVSSDYTAENYGWTDIRDARIVRGMDGYEIRLPKAMPID